MPADRTPLGVQISPVLVEIENALWDHDFYVELPIQLPIEGFKAATKIMMSAIIDKAWVLMEAEQIPQQQREEMITACGQEFRMFVKKYTGIDTHELYKDEDGKH